MRLAYRADAALSWVGGCIALAVIGAVAGIDATYQCAKRHTKNG